MKPLYLAACAAILATSGTSAVAQDNHDHHNHDHDHAHHLHSGHDHGISSPIGVMGDHMHDKGEWMLSYRFMRMEMDGNRNGTDSLSPAEIVTNFNTPSGGNLRVVPTEMTMDMHMFGAMYGVTDWLTVMGMAKYLDNEMDHITFQGMSGTTELGNFTTNSSGWGDASVSGLFRVFENETSNVHLKAGLSLPTGSIDEEDTVLTPMNTRTVLRLPYMMQLGSGTYDLLPGITYNYHKDQWAFGAQYNAMLRLEDENDEGYRWGNRHDVSLWSAYQAKPWLSLNGRMRFEQMGKIKGSDDQITAPVQTADPDNYGGRWVTASLGANILPQSGILKGHDFGVEVAVPLYQDLNGPQMERDYAFTLGWKKSF